MLWSFRIIGLSLSEFKNRAPLKRVLVVMGSVVKVHAYEHFHNAEKITVFILGEFKNRGSYTSGHFI